MRWTLNRKVPGLAFPPLSAIRHFHSPERVLELQCFSFHLLICHPGFRKGMLGMWPCTGVPAPSSHCKGKHVQSSSDLACLTTEELELIYGLVSRCPLTMSQDVGVSEAFKLEANSNGTFHLIPITRRVLYLPLSRHYFWDLSNTLQ